ncbi:hypothetical protein G6O69_05905 [Pseudenhygromyxa sp. WMMC2535]|uniref:hypothetical protein n=1 Tax=Pseudenhygromyxa sp. WMMC2535 TaxID=2712867 RepID=UPI001556EA89|nr:hypothetical protein [Pseudenhygromyxa sp. WMMC2535]NVB37357.1 hypothetical protein [Pseudenhygromyxa sp. WMMC2535]
MLLALLAKAEYPKAPLDLQLDVGWLALLIVALMVLWTWTRAESFRRAIFAREDPRLFALWRIGLGVMTIQNFWNLLLHWRMLWTDEGMFTDDEARSRLGRAALSGWTEVDGFLDGWAVLKFFWGKYSLLFFDSNPEFVWAYLAALFVLLVLFTVGFRSRVLSVVLLIMINSIYNRNSVYLEGHDTVFRCLWLYTIFARTDEAWSVDNWLRQRRERRLVEQLRAGTVAYDWRHFLDRAGHWLTGCAAGLWFCAHTGFTNKHVLGVTILGLSFSALVGVFELRRRKSAMDAGSLEIHDPVRFQLIPAWPRYLFIIQLMIIYCATGLWKTGPVWQRGDALYYALNMDHFYRFEGFTQVVSFWFGTNMFKLMSWVTLWWEKLFPLIGVGLILGWGLRYENEPWYQAQNVWWRKWLGRLSLIGVWLAAWRLAVIALPWCLALQADKSPTPADAGLRAVHIVFAAVLPGLVALWFVLGRWQLKIKKPLRLRKITGSEEEHFVIGQQFMRNWLFGRRLWLTLGVIFHGILFVFMNIGMFPLIMMWIYVAYFEAGSFLKIFRWFAVQLRRWKATRWLAPKWCDAALAEDDSVLETTAQTWRRDGAGPWWLDPWRLLAAPFLLITRKATLAEVASDAQERGARIPDALVLALGVVLFALMGLRGLEAKTEADMEAEHGEVGVEQSPEDAASAREARKLEAVAKRERIEGLGDATWWWAYAVLGFAAVSHFRKRGPFDRVVAGEPGQPGQPGQPDQAAASDATADGEAASEDEDATVEEAPEAAKASKPASGASKPESGASEPAPGLATPPLIPGTLMRTIVLGFMAWHFSAVTALFIPTYSVTQAWRGDVSKVFGGWARGLNVTQSWKMFSPNPPRSNTFMRTVVVDQDEEPYMVGKDHYTNRPKVFWYNDRERKMHRRMVGKSKWYLKYWGQYHCRKWAFEHDGQLPKEVKVLRLKTNIPKPESLKGPSDPRERKLKRNVVETYTCKSDDVAPDMKQRRGWPLTERDEDRLESEARRLERSVESTRESWAKRTDFGGEPRKKRDDDKNQDESDGEKKGAAKADKPKFRTRKRK